MTLNNKTMGGLLDLAEKYSSPIQYEMEHSTRDDVLEYIYMSRELSRWYNVYYEDGTKSTQFVHDKDAVIEVEARKYVQKENASPFWHVITAIELQDGTIEKFDLTEPKQKLQELIETTKANIEYALEQLKGLDWDYDRDRRLICDWKFEVDYNTNHMNRYVELLNKIQK